MKKSPAIIFDLGKVLVDFDWSRATGKIMARCQWPPDNFDTFLGASALLWQYECGQLTRRQFYDAVCAAIGFAGDLAEFSSYFADIFTAMPRTIALHTELRQRGFKTFIFSNTNDLAIEHVRHNFPFFANFDGYIFSFEVGAMKPQPKIYEALEALAGKRGADLIYIDDRPENIAAGAARGWQSILHETPEQTRQALAGMEIITPP